MTLTDRIDLSQSLSELAEILRTARAENTDEIQDIEGSNYMADLPVFGKNKISQTCGIFSWDDTHYMDGDYNLHEREEKKPEWAVIQLGYCIFGTGETRDEALADAADHMDDTETIDDVKKSLAHDYTHAMGLFHGDMIATNDEDLISEYS